MAHFMLPVPEASVPEVERCCDTNETTGYERSNETTGYEPSNETAGYEPLARSSAAAFSQRSDRGYAQARTQGSTTHNAPQRAKPTLHHSWQHANHVFFSSSLLLSSLELSDTLSL